MHPDYLQAFVRIPFVVTVFPRQFWSHGHEKEVDRVGDDDVVVRGAD